MVAPKKSSPKPSKKSSPSSPSSPRTPRAPSSPGPTTERAGGRAADLGALEARVVEALATPEGRVVIARAILGMPSPAPTPTPPTADAPPGNVPAPTPMAPPAPAAPVRISAMLRQNGAHVAAAPAPPPPGYAPPYDARPPTPAQPTPMGTPPRTHPTLARGAGPLYLYIAVGLDCRVCHRGEMFTVDERPGADVAIHCSRCDHSATIPVHQLHGLVRR